MSIKRIMSLLAMASVVSFCAAEESASAAGAPRQKPKFTEDGKIVIGNKTITRKEFHEKMERVRMKRTGGVVREAGSAKGVFVVVDAQKRVPRREIEPVCATLDQWIRVQSKVAETDGAALASISPKEYLRAIKAAGGTLGVVLVDAEGLPGLLTAPEDGWSAVNVAALAADKPDAATLASRVRKELLRAFAFVCGGAYMTKADFVMRDVIKPGDLDALPTEQFGLEIVSHVMQSAPRYGLVPWHQATYKKACEEGWALAPTNEFQKAIFEQVKAEKERGPTNPITIPPPNAKK